MTEFRTSGGRRTLPALLALALAVSCLVGTSTAGPAEAHQNKWNNWNNGGHGHNKWYQDDRRHRGYNGGFYYYPQPYVQYAPPPVYYAPPPPVYYAPPPVYYAPPPLFSVTIPLRID